MSTSTTATPVPAQTLPEDQLLELLIQLQKTTPEQARVILNSQPQIGYALMPLMAKMGVVSLEVVQRTLAGYTSSQAQTQVQTQSAAAPSIPAPAVPAHLTQQQAPYGHQPTPPPAQVPPSVPAGSYPGATSTGASIPASGYAGYPPPPPAVQNGGYPQATGATQPQYGQQQQGWNVQLQQQAPPQGTQGSSGGAGASGAPGVPGLGALGNIPEDQREMIIRVLSMTPDQIRSLPPQERAITVQLRTTLGLPVE